MSTIVGPSDYVLECVNLYYTGHIEPSTWLKQLTGTTRSGIILRDVSFEVHSGEIIAILGSKGSGKKALLDVIACRSQMGSSTKKGYVLLNGVTMNRRLFNSAGSYLSGVSDEYLGPPGLSVYQILFYEACLSLNIPSSVRKIRVRQILSDVALTQIASCNINSLSTSERRRLSIGLQLMKDPVILLADEPAWNLDPLNTYFIISILSNYAKKYGRIIVVTMEKPRSDIFPFLDRVTYLCLGDVLYSGHTRLMLDYFRTIGFPCPEVENPLMYYLCLATVDRRSHERFIESNNQIALLVEKFKMESNSFRKGDSRLLESGPPGYAGSSRGPPGSAAPTPLHALGTPGILTTMGTLIIRNYASTFLFNWNGVSNIFYRLVLLPLIFFLMWIFYFGSNINYQRTYVTHNGLVLNTLAVTYFTAIWTAIVTFEPHRIRYYQENRNGHYGGPTFLLSYSLASLPYTLITCLIGSRIAFELTGLGSTSDWLLYFCVLFACYSWAQQQAFGILLTVKNHLYSLAFLVGLHALGLTLASGTVRTTRGLPEWLYYVTYITQQRYAGAFLNQMNFGQFHNDSIIGKSVLTKAGEMKYCSTNSWVDGCRYDDGNHYLNERYYNNVEDKDDLNFYFNFGLCFVFPVCNFFLNLLIYSIPLPGIVKNKFRD